jgi:hypothetical protein
MTDPNDQEPALASLFERTARTLPDEARARLGRRARDVRRPMPRGGLIWAPALAAAAAIAYLAVPVRHVAPVSAAHSAVASAHAATESATPAPVSDDTSDVDDPAFAVLAGEPSDVEPLDLGPLMMGAEPADEHRGGVGHARTFPERQVERSRQ